MLFCIILFVQFWCVMFVHSVYVAMLCYFLLYCSVLVCNVCFIVLCCVCYVIVVKLCYVLFCYIVQFWYVMFVPICYVT